MGIIGFLFNLREFKNSNISNQDYTNISLDNSISSNNSNLLKLNGINLEKDFLVIFTQTNKIDYTHIIGIDYLFELKNSDFIFLDKNLNFQKHIILGEFKYLYGKISVTDRTMLNLKDNTIWLNPRDYKKLYELFEIRDDFIFTEENFKKNILNLYDFFK